jgi:hypothetical protein
MRIMRDLSYWEALFCSCMSVVSGGVIVATGNQIGLLIIFLPFIISLSGKGVKR